MNQQQKNIVIIGLSITVVVIISLMVSATVSHMNHASNEPVDTPEPHNYIATPSGRTHVYKFVDDDGSKCYVAEGQRDDVSLQCEIKP